MFLLDSPHCYRALRDHALGRLRDAPPAHAILPRHYSELELQSLWFSGAFGDTFTSTCGRSVRVSRFGEWNRIGGPDFKGCAVEIDGQQQNGAIEIDPEPEDWERHGHSTNPAFDQVVLHVFGGHGPAARRFFTRTSDHRNIVQVRLDLDLLNTPDRDRPPACAVHGRCSTRLAELESREMESLLQASARHRLDAKARRFARSAQIHGWDQAIFEGIAGALGYHPNRLPMRVLAQRHPLQNLLSHPPSRREAILFGSGGFLDAVGHDSARPATRSYLRGLWEQWWRLRDSASVLPGIRWSLSGIRPLNHPHRRLGALAALLSAWPEFRALLPPPVSAPHPPFPDWPRRVTTFLTNLQHPHWSRHYTLSSAPCQSPLAIFGRDRIHDILGNVLFPIAIHQDPSHWTTYLSLPGGKMNEKLERAATRLLGPHPKKSSLVRPFYRQQGLLQIYEDFCLEDTSGCTSCPFPEQIRQWT
ncbi:MAG: DUF2851 family protein [Verrucomicrobia bacterium]|nr:DUF2851 family protein [Verrucomicrobiota bacterium]